MRRRCSAGSGWPGALRPVVPPLARSRLARTVLLGSMFARPWDLDPETAERASLAFLDSPGFGAVVSATPRRIAADRLAAIACPVRILWGRLDPLLFSWRTQRWAGALPAADVVVLERSGHVPMAHVPGRVAAAILEFTRQAA